MLLHTYKSCNLHKQGFNARHKNYADKIINHLAFRHIIILNNSLQLNAKIVIISVMGP